MRYALRFSGGKDSMLALDRLKANGIEGIIFGNTHLYHTFVTNGPLFTAPLQIELGRRVEMEGHGLIDVIAHGPHHGSQYSEDAIERSRSSTS